MHEQETWLEIMKEIISGDRLDLPLLGNVSRL